MYAPLYTLHISHHARAARNYSASAPIKVIINSIITDLSASAPVWSTPERSGSSRLLWILLSSPIASHNSFLPSWPCLVIDICQSQTMRFVYVKRRVTPQSIVQTTPNRTCFLNKQIYLMATWTLPLKWWGTPGEMRATSLSQPLPFGSFPHHDLITTSGEQRYISSGSPILMI